MIAQPHFCRYLLFFYTFMIILNNFWAYLSGANDIYYYQLTTIATIFVITCVFIIYLFLELFYDFIRNI